MGLTIFILNSEKNTIHDPNGLVTGMQVFCFGHDLVVERDINNIPYMENDSFVFRPVFETGRWVCNDVFRKPRP